MFPLLRFLLVQYWAVFLINSVNNESTKSHSTPVTKSQDSSVVTKAHGSTINGSAASKSNKSLSIISFPSSLGWFPYHVAIGELSKDKSYRLFCSGCIIGHTVVLTAAHCTLSASDLYVIASCITNIQSPEDALVKKVKKKVLHENFNMLPLRFDLCILLLESRISYSEYVYPIGVATQQLKGNERCVVTGWGFSNSSLFHTQADTLQASMISILPEKKCQQSNFNDVGTICSSYIKKYSCFGDSGAPVVCKNKLHGIVTYTDDWKPYCVQGNLAIFTDVLYYSSWIKKFLHESEKRSGKANCIRHLTVTLFIPVFIHL